MARNFNGTSDKLLVGSAPMSGPPYTMALWMRPDDLSGNEACFAICDTAGDVNYHYVGRFDTVALAGANDGTTSAFPFSSNALSTTDWNLVVVTSSGPTNREITLNADHANAGTNADNINPTGLDSTSLGNLNTQTPSAFFDGSIAQACVWNVVLSDTEQTQLFERSQSLDAVQRDNILGFWDILGRSPEDGVLGGADLVVTGTSVVTHPELVYPFGVVSRGRRVSSGKGVQEGSGVGGDEAADIWRPDLN